MRRMRSLVADAPSVTARHVVTLVELERFFFQAEDGIRDATVTGVQTCALPISGGARAHAGSPRRPRSAPWPRRPPPQIGRASCRESVDLGGRRIIKKKKQPSVVCHSGYCPNPPPPTRPPARLHAR